MKDSMEFITVISKKEYKQGIKKQREGFKEAKRQGILMQERHRNPLK